MLLFCVFFVNLHFETNDIRNHRKPLTFADRRMCAPIVENIKVYK